MKKFFLFFGLLLGFFNFASADGNARVSLDGPREVKVLEDFKIELTVTATENELKNSTLKYRITKPSPQNSWDELSKGNLFEEQKGGRQSQDFMFREAGSYLLEIEMVIDGADPVPPATMRIDVPDPTVEIISGPKRRLKTSDEATYEFSLRDFPSGYDENQLQIFEGNFVKQVKNQKITTTELELTEDRLYRFRFAGGDHNGETLPNPKIKWKDGDEVRTMNVIVGGNPTMELINKPNPSEEIGGNRPLGVPFSFAFSPENFGMGDDYEYRWSREYLNPPEGEEPKRIYEDKGSELKYTLDKTVLTNPGEYSVQLDIFEKGKNEVSSTDEMLIRVLMPSLSFYVYEDENRGKTTSQINKNNEAFFKVTAKDFPLGTYFIEIFKDDKMFITQLYTFDSYDMVFGQDKNGKLADALKHTFSDIKEEELKVEITNTDTAIQDIIKDYTEQKTKLKVVESCEENPNQGHCRIESESGVAKVALDPSNVTYQGTCVKANFVDEHTDENVLVDYNNDGLAERAPLPIYIANHPDQAVAPCFCYSRCVSMTGNSENCDKNVIERYAMVWSERVDENGELVRYPKAKPARYCVAFSMPIMGQSSVHGMNGAEIFSGFVRLIYLFAASIIGLIAVLVIVFSGIQMILTGLSDQKEAAKSRIGSALLSMVILFMSAGILRAINPEFFRGGGDKTASEQLDQDNDQIDDSWEVQNGLNPNDPFDGLEDFDGDGLINIQEFAQGCDPRIKDSNTITNLDGTKEITCKLQ